MALPRTPTLPAYRPVDERIKAVNQTLTSAGLQPMRTADQPDPAMPTKRQLAEAAKALMAWREGIGQLSIEAPSEWDNHAQKLASLPGIDRPFQVTLFRQMKQKAAEYGVGYNSLTKRFYLMELPSLD